MLNTSSEERAWVKLKGIPGMGGKMVLKPTQNRSTWNLCFILKCCSWEPPSFGILPEEFWHVQHHPDIQRLGDSVVESQCPERSLGDL